MKTYELQLKPVQKMTRLDFNKWGKQAYYYI